MNETTESLLPVWVCSLIATIGVGIVIIFAPACCVDIANISVKDMINPPSGLTIWIYPTEGGLQNEILIGWKLDTPNNGVWLPVQYSLDGVTWTDVVYDEVKTTEMIFPTAGTYYLQSRTFGIGGVITSNAVKYTVFNTT